MERLFVKCKLHNIRQITQIWRMIIIFQYKQELQQVYILLHPHSNSGIFKCTPPVNFLTVDLTLLTPRLPRGTFPIAKGGKSSADDISILVAPERLPWFDDKHTSVLCAFPVRRSKWQSEVRISLQKRTQTNVGCTHVIYTGITATVDQVSCGCGATTAKKAH